MISRKKLETNMQKYLLNYYPEFEGAAYSLTGFGKTDGIKLSPVLCTI